MVFVTDYTDTTISDAYWVDLSFNRGYTFIKGKGNLWFSDWSNGGPQFPGEVYIPEDKFRPCVKKWALSKNQSDWHIFLACRDYVYKNYICERPSLIGKSE